MTDYLNKIYLEKKVKTPVCFFDETGLLHNDVDKFFILGMVKCLRPHKLASFVQRLRDKNHFYDEIKWKKVNAKNLFIMKHLIDAFFTTKNTSFYCIVQKMCVHSVVRIHSKGSDIVQVADLLMGAVNYEFKLKNNLIDNPSKAKVELLAYLKSVLTVDDLTRYMKREKFNIMTFDPSKKRT